jgi:hypothetical protein
MRGSAAMPAERTITVASRFNGPRDSGNGGYAAGLLARHVDGVAAVSLRSPVPLDTELAVVAGEDGTVSLRDGEVLVAEAQAIAGVDAEVPAPVTPAEAREAAARYAGLAEGPFSRCFVCGRTRGDALGVFAGSVTGRDVVASPWTPSAEMAGDDGAVAPELVSAVLDCPTYFALYDDPTTLSFLARLTVRHDGPVEAGAEHVVIAWPIGFDGRKHHAGSAVLAADGTPLAVARALLIEARAAA